MTITGTGVAVAIAVIIALGFLFFGPSFFSPIQSQPIMPNDTTGAAGLGAPVPGGDAATPTTLQITDLQVGTGAEAAAGDTVAVEYVGMLTDGTTFDSSQSHGQPISFTLGAGQVIPGWEQGIAGMKEGGQRVLVIPPSLGYGAVANGPIPANSTLVFEVQLVSVQKGQ